MKTETKTDILAELASGIRDGLIACESAETTMYAPRNPGEEMAGESCPDTTLVFRRGDEVIGECGVWACGLPASATDVASGADADDFVQTDNDGVAAGRPTWHVEGPSAIGIGGDNVATIHFDLPVGISARAILDAHYIRDGKYDPNAHAFLESLRVDAALPVTLDEDCVDIWAVERAQASAILALLADLQTIEEAAHAAYETISVDPRD